MPEEWTFEQIVMRFRWVLGGIVNVRGGEPWQVRLLTRTNILIYISILRLAHHCLAGKAARAFKAAARCGLVPGLRCLRYPRICPARLWTKFIG